MALRDWKKGLTMTNFYSWNKNNTSTNLAVFKEKYEKKWQVIIDSTRGTKTLSKNLTKQKALDYAKSYMKKH